MTPLEIGIASVIAIVVLIYLGVYIPIALGAVSFVSIWLMRDNFTLAMNLLKIAIGDSAMEYTFATIPLFTFMGLIVSKAGLGRDVYEVMSKPVVKVDPDMDIAHCARMFDRFHMIRALVEEDGKLIGTVSPRALVIYGLAKMEGID